MKNSNGVPRAEEILKFADERGIEIRQQHERSCWNRKRMKPSQVLKCLDGAIPKKSLGAIDLGFEGGFCDNYKEVAAYYDLGAELREAIYND